MPHEHALEHHESVPPGTTTTGAQSANGARSTAYLATAGPSVQLGAEPGTEGTALGLWMMVSMGLIPIGSLLIGVVTVLMDLQLALASNGGLAAPAGVASGWFTFPAWFRTRRLVNQNKLATAQAHP